MTLSADEHDQLRYLEERTLATAVGLAPLPPGVVSEQKNEDQPVGTRTLGSFELVRPDGPVAGFCVQSGKILAHAHLTYIGRLNRRLSKFIP